MHVYHIYKDDKGHINGRYAWHWSLHKLISLVKRMIWHPCNRRNSNYARMSPSIYAILFIALHECVRSYFPLFGAGLITSWAAAICTTTHFHFEWQKAVVDRGSSIYSLSICAAEAFSADTCSERAIRKDAWTNPNCTCTWHAFTWSTFAPCIRRGSYNKRAYCMQNDESVAVENHLTAHRRRIRLIATNTVCVATVELNNLSEKVVSDVCERVCVPCVCVCRRLHLSIRLSSSFSRFHSQLRELHTECARRTNTRSGILWPSEPIKAAWRQ